MVRATVPVLLLGLGALFGCEAGEEGGEGVPQIGVEIVERPEGVEGQTEPSRWDEAEKDIRRLSVDAFPEFPQHVRTRLEEIGCLVPQSWADPEAHNVVRGTFAVPEQEDWAALCSTDGAHQIVVVWGGPVRCAETLAEAEDRRLLQGVGRDRIGFSRAIEPVDPEQIRRYHDEFGGPEPPDPLTHQGINDVFVGKASVVWYCEAGEWLRLTGMD